ncbi:SH3 domain-binding glutamic acid-rich-like protein 3 isoform X1 [Monodelphis domestica]|uniref:SH3 domain-binding glutamic acid-rich-like protein 3 isoform X1 n=1 Tax=Monodelphis domestica TaxID=13616 RepID=UPI0024E1B05D|nr:SH3 domain-binding glutamic acid-rich-like protein 3 isoform X1 [Monodelphis domestica]
MSGLRVYSTSVTGSREIKSQQSEVTRILDGKRIQYELVDISQDNALREEMRTLAGDPKAIPPQICNGNQYCGVRDSRPSCRGVDKGRIPDTPALRVPFLPQDYELFVEAVEQDTLQEFLKLD